MSLTSSVFFIKPSVPRLYHLVLKSFILFIVLFLFKLMSPHKPVRSFIPQSAEAIIRDKLLPERLLPQALEFALLSSLTTSMKMALFEGARVLRKAKQGLDLTCRMEYLFHCSESAFVNMLHNGAPLRNNCLSHPWHWALTDVSKLGRNRN